MITKYFIQFYSNRLLLTQMFNYLFGIIRETVKQDFEQYVRYFDTIEKSIWNCIAYKKYSLIKHFSQLLNHRSLDFIDYLIFCKILF